MMERIIEVKENKDGFTCLICCKKQATLTLKIKRPAHKDTVASFHVCDNCLAKMQREIQIQSFI